MPPNKRSLPRCRTVLFRDQPELHRHSVLYIDNRPGQEHLFQRRLKTLHDDLCQGADSHPDRGLLHDLLAPGLSLEWFVDTAKVAEWIGAVNHYANFGSLDMVPLELVVAHAETHIEQINELLNSARPAGIILSGSPKMLTEVYRHPVIQATLRCIVHALERRIPLLGICFGLHLLGYARYGILPEWLTVPDGMGVEFHPRLNGAFSRCTPGSKRMIFGSRMIKRLCVHPVLNGADKVLGLKVHAQHYWVDHPQFPIEAVLAVSDRFFRASQMSKQRAQVRQRIIEVLQAGPVAIGTQLHPELSSEFLLALLHFDDIRQTLLREGHNLSLVSQELDRHPPTFWAGQRVGYNFAKRVLVPAYISRSAPNEPVRRTLYARVESRDPALTL